MAFDQTTRNRLQRFVAEARELLVREFTYQLQYEYGMDPVTGEISDLERLTHLDDSRRETARLLRDTLEHYTTGDPSKKKECLDRIVREQAFTVLNRLCALRMAEARGILIESIANGYNSKGFQLYFRLAGTALGETGEAYRCYLFSLFDELALDLPVLFDRFSPQGRLFPRDSVLLELLGMINHPEIAPLWSEDETIGWIYQYFNSAEERREMRDQSPTPRNSRELAVRNQFFTPRYVVEFLTDNTLGRIWYEMTQGSTVLKNQCRYLVRRPNEIFLSEGEEVPAQEESTEELSLEELLKLPVYIPLRRLKDPREIRMLDPACGSMHFGLYAFDLFEKIYEEAWNLEGQRGPEAFVRSDELKPLRETYESKEALMLDVPRLIIEYNIHGIDIDPRAVQIAGLSLWLRAQRSWKEQGVKPQDRPRIRKSNVVCAEPMPGDKGMLREFTQHLHPRVLGELVEEVFKKMELAGEAGSLLKIEKEIEEIISQARDEFNKELLRRKAAEGELFPETLPLRQQSLFDFSDLPDKTSFWNQAESKILHALRVYAEQAEGINANRKRLFAQDAVKGFAFIDLCRRRYDVILTNPPFGDATSPTLSVIRREYPDFADNLYVAFYFRAKGLITKKGYIGMITSRTFITYRAFEAFRRELLSKSQFICLADLGWGVLDGAQVETAAYVTLESGKDVNFVGPFFRLISDPVDRKETELIDCVSWLNSNRIYFLQPSLISKLPGVPLCYWSNPKFVKSIVNAVNLHPSFAYVGLGASPHAFFFRTWWEIPLFEFDSRWKRICRGGDYSPYHRPNALVIDWKRDGEVVKQYIIDKYPYLNGNYGWKIQDEDKYGRPGLTWGKRNERFNVQSMPAGHIFTDEGQGIIPNNLEDAMFLLGYLNSALVSYYLSLTSGLQKHYIYIRSIPIVDLTSASKELISSSALEILKIKERWASTLETYSNFVMPTIVPLRSFSSLNTIFSFSYSLFKKDAEIITKKRTLIDNTILKELELSKGDVDQIIGLVSDYPKDVPCVELFTGEKNEHIKSIIISIISYILGVAFGRWDIRFATGDKMYVENSNLFHMLPVCPPGMLQSIHGLPAEPKDVLPEYPLRITWNGILVDDEGHPEDIVGRVREAMEVIWKDKAGDIEQEACEILGIQSLRKYFRKPSLFFAEHLKRYSKSRRQAPIYWPISTPSGSYTLWLYYHRLTDQTLYTCVNDFIEPKLKQVAESAARLRQKTDRSRAEERELERLIDLELELKDFRDELLKIASFWKPNLNDGVQITAAPLWKFFRHTPWQRKLKETWQKLERGEYDWAHLAYSIWPDRVREKCKRDKSLAIAHDLEDLYEEQPAGTRRTRGRRR